MGFESNSRSIAVVDDQPQNLQILTAMLEKHGYAVRTYESGSSALQDLYSKLPDLFLLDVDMPEMDGIELCSRLKKDPRSSEIPVIFVSALADTTYKIEAFQAGGVDYISKPFQIDEVIARVDTQFRLRDQQAELESSYRRLRHLEILRDKLLHKIVHDMKSPISSIHASLEVLKMLTDDSTSSEVQKMIKVAYRGTDRLLEMAATLLDLKKLEDGELELDRQNVDFLDVLESALEKLEDYRDRIQIVSDALPSNLPTFIDPVAIRRVIVNVLDNAIRYSPRDSSVSVSLSVEDQQIRLLIKDSGPGIPEEYLDQIFDKYAQVRKECDKCLPGGLSLAYCKLAVEAHGGKISLSSKSGEGSTFVIYLPLGDF